MLSNTKLSADQKDWMKHTFKLIFPDAFFMNNEYVTLCIIPEFKNSKMMRVSISIMSDNEKKFRYKVGKFHAACRMVSNEYVLLPRHMSYYEFMNAITA